MGLRSGSFATWDPYADLNVPLADGISARIAAEYQSNDSWIDRVKGDRWSVQPSISFQIDPNTDLLVQGQFNNRRQLEYSGLPAAQALAGQIDRNAFPGSPIGQPETSDDNRMVTATLRHAFTDRLKLTVTGRYYDSSIDNHSDRHLRDLSTRPHRVVYTGWRQRHVGGGCGSRDAYLHGRSGRTGKVRHQRLLGLADPGGGGVA